MVYPCAWEEAVETLDLRLWQYESHRIHGTGIFTYIYWCVVSTHLKNTSQNENLPQVEVKKKIFETTTQFTIQIDKRKANQNHIWILWEWTLCPQIKQFYDENLSLPLPMPTPIEGIRHYQGTITHHHPLIRPFSWGVALERRPYIPMKSLRRAQDLDRKGKQKAVNFVADLGWASHLKSKLVKMGIFPK